MPKKDFGQVVTNKLEILESPLTILPGMEPVFTVLISGTGTIDSSLSMKLYKGSKDISGTNLTGSMALSGRAITCKKIVSLTAGDYVFYIYFTDQGVLESRFCRFYVPREGA